MTHDADPLALVSACESEHSADVVELEHVFQEILGHEFCAKGIARHDDGFGYLAVLCPYVGSRYVACHLSFSITRQMY